MPEERFFVKGAFPLVGLRVEARLSATGFGRGDVLNRSGMTGGSIL
jgi:hypothetical protein